MSLFRQEANRIQKEDRVQYVINDVHPNDWVTPGIKWTNWVVIRRKFEDVEGKMDFWRIIPGYDWEHFTVEAGEGEQGRGLEWPIRGFGKVVVNAYPPSPELEVIWINRPEKP